MKTIGVFVLLVAALGVLALGSYAAASKKYQSEIIRLKGDIAIYKNQAENYEKVLRTIRETAQSATVIEKAQ